MRILLCTKQDLTSLICLNDLLPRLGGHQVSVLLAERLRPAEVAVPELSLMKFIERDLPFNLLFPLIDRHPEVAEGAVWATCAGLRRRHGVPMTAVQSLKTPETKRLFTDLSPDLIVSLRFSFIFPEALLATARLAALNLHGSLLPERAGIYGHFRAMANGESHTGATLHHMDSGIDTGDIVSVAHLAVDRDRSFYSHNITLHRMGAQLVLDAVNMLERGRTLPRLPQDMSRRCYGSYPDSADFVRFREAGLSMVDFPEYYGLLRRFVPAATPAEGLLSNLVAAGH